MNRRLNHLNLSAKAVEDIGCARAVSRKGSGFVKARATVSETVFSPKKRKDQHRWTRQGTEGFLGRECVKGRRRAPRIGNSLHRLEPNGWLVRVWVPNRLNENQSVWPMIRKQNGESEIVTLLKSRTKGVVIPGRTKHYVLIQAALRTSTQDLVASKES